MVKSVSEKVKGYDEFLRDLKERIRNAQVRAALAVNRELVLLYWQTGRDILIRQQQQGWGAKVVDRLAADLRRAFPEIKGFSSRNLKYMRAFAESYDEVFVQQVVAQIPWGHNVRILDYVKDVSEREWYIRQTIQHGWSRNVLVHQIESGLYRRQGKALTNLTGRYRRHSLNWHSKFSKIRTVSTSLPLDQTLMSEILSVVCSATSVISYWNWA